MAADEPTGTPAPQGDKGGASTPKKRRRRRRPRRKPGTATTAAGSGAQAKKDGGRQGGSKASPASGTTGSGAAGKGRKRGGKKRGGKKRSSTAKAQGGRSKGTAKRGAPRPKIPTTREVSAGGVVYRRGDDGIEVVLASRRTRRGQLAWGLAKGGIEHGETKEVAAIREVREETGMTAEIEADLGDTKYMYVWDDIRIRKTVHFFLMRHTGGNVDDRDDEMEEIRWFPLERAIKRAAYRGERDMLVKASELLA
jgi:8-oxo-dGTP pyrophosphatase MutT (NUDIX family)